MESLSYWPHLGWSGSKHEWIFPLTYFSFWRMWLLEKWPHKTSNILQPTLNPRLFTQSIWYFSPAFQTPPFIIKCPLSPHKVSDNNPHPTWIPALLKRKFLRGGYQDWNSGDRAPPSASPSLLWAHNSLPELAEGTHPVWGSPLSWWATLPKGNRKIPNITQKNPTKTKSEQSTSAGNLVFNVKIKDGENFHSPPPKGFMYFKAFLVCLFHQWLS